MIAKPDKDEFWTVTGTPTLVTRDCDIHAWLDEALAERRQATQRAQRAMYWQNHYSRNVMDELLVSQY